MTGPEFRRHLDERLLRQPWFALAWAAFLFVMLGLVGWPLRDAALVCWVYGTGGYAAGIRVLPGKPIRFSNGERAPILPDIVTGFGAFAITVFGLTLLLVWVLRLYERRRGAGDESRRE